MASKTLRMTIDAAQADWIRAVVTHAIEQARGLRRASRADAGKSLMAFRVKYLWEIERQLDGSDLVIPIDADHSPALARDLEAIATNIRSSFRIAADDTESHAAVKAAFLDHLSKEIQSAL